MTLELQLVLKTRGHLVGWGSGPQFSALFLMDGIVSGYTTHFAKVLIRNGLRVRLPFHPLKVLKVIWDLFPNNFYS